MAFPTLLQSNDEAFDFQIPVASRVIRGWDRIPKSSFAPRHRGRKVWKRYNLRSKELEPERERDEVLVLGLEGSDNEEFEATDASRPIKRLCLDQKIICDAKEGKNRSARYVAALQDKVLGTPKRKLAGRESIKPKNPYPRATVAHMDSPPFPSKDVIHQVDTSTGTLGGQSIQQIYSVEEKAQRSVGNRNLVNISTSSINHQRGCSPYKGEDVSNDVQALALGPLLDDNPVPAIENTVSSDEKLDFTPNVISSQLERGDSLTQSQQPTNGCAKTSTSEPEIHGIHIDDPSNVNEIVSPTKITWPRKAMEHLKCSANLQCSIKPLESEGVSNEEKETLLATIGPENNGLTVTNATGNDTDTKSAKIIVSNQHTSYDTDRLNDSPNVGHSSSGIIYQVPSLHLGNDEHAPSMIATIVNEETEPTCDGSNLTARTSDNEIVSIDGASDEPEDLPKSRTRSGARFSDETTMLKEFLNRAQSKKAARSKNFSAEVSECLASPRKALADLDRNSPSPQKPRSSSSRPGTPPSKQNDERNLEASNEVIGEPTSYRRSTRTRFPAPSKTQPIALSFIPVRRADGTDPVVLQKSIPQEVAIMTRTNTRRNKGQSKAPKLALQSLVAETVVATDTNGHGKENAKSVGWDERLVYYQDEFDVQQAKEGNEEKQETRSKVRRLKGLGGMNGTPAPRRKTDDMGSSNSTPAPKRRGKIR